MQQHVSPLLSDLFCVCVLLSGINGVGSIVGALRGRKGGLGEEEVSWGRGMSVCMC